MVPLLKTDDWVFIMDNLELIKQKIGIVELISEYFPLKKAGVNFKANCPFHHERTPSFVVSPERQIWHCFGCDKGGDIFKFVMEKEGLDFKEALEMLAKKAGITLKRLKKETNTLDRLLEANIKAGQFYHYMLLEHPLGKMALEYLKKRGLTDKTIQEFNLGYAPLNWESLTKFLKKRGFSEREIIDSGLAVASKKSCYDRFRGRIMFPLTDGKDRIIGFSGRVLGKLQPKYINTPQTDIFDKGKFLYGFNLSKGAIREKKAAVVVEGEMDMILSFQTGVLNIAASKGTALTENQVELLKKNTEDILLCFDADFAGDAAVRRGIELADKANLNIKVIEISGSKDPAEVCLKDPQAWKDSVENAIPIYDFYLSSVSKRFSLNTATGKKSAFGELLPIIKSISDPMVKEHYIQKLASLLKVKDEMIRAELKKLSQNSTTPVASVIDQGKDDKIQPKDRRKLLEEYLIALLLHIPSQVTYVPNFPETLFTQEYLRQIYVLLVLFLDKISFRGKSFKISDFISQVPADLVDFIDKLYLMAIDEKLMEVSAWQKELDCVISELKKMLIKASLEKLSLEIKQAQDFEKVEALETLNKRFRDLSVKLKNL